MSPAQTGGGQRGLDLGAIERTRELALRARCAEYRDRLARRDPQTVAGCAALGVHRLRDGAPGAQLALSGECWGQPYIITWPGLVVSHAKGPPADLRTEALWLHYLDRADGHRLTGRWVNLSQIGGQFYRQAFQGYSGDELAAAWGNRADELRRWCLEQGGWGIGGLGDLAFEWRVLPRVPICLCYRRPADLSPAWATVLFDAATEHYLAADVAAIVGKQLTDRLKPPAAPGGDRG